MNDFNDYRGQYTGCNPDAVGRAAEARIADLEMALRDVLLDVQDYEKSNKLSPNPGRTDCWDSVARARVMLGNEI